MTFVPADELGDRFCVNVEIFDDDIFEFDEEFTVNLVSARPEGEFIEDTTCIKIIDDDSELLQGLMDYIVKSLVAIACT